MGTENENVSTSRFKKRWIILGAFVTITLVLGFILKDYIFVSSWNYKITVKIDTPEGVESGSAVRRIEAKFIPDFLPEAASVQYDVYGEAVMIDLGERGVVFGLIPYTPINEFFNAFSSPYGKSSHRESMKYYRSLGVGSEGQLREGVRLVRFKNLNDPASIELLYGSVFNRKTQEHVFIDNFSHVFGEGFGIRNIELEVVQGVVKHQIGGVLSWLSEYYNKRLDGQRFGNINSNNELANSLSAGAFRTGDNHE